MYSFIPGNKGVHKRSKVHNSIVLYMSYANYKKNVRKNDICICRTVDVSYNSSIQFKIDKVSAAIITSFTTCVYVLVLDVSMASASVLF